MGIVDAQSNRVGPCKVRRGKKGRVRYISPSISGLVAKLHADLFTEGALRSERLGDSDYVSIEVIQLAVVRAIHSLDFTVVQNDMVKLQEGYKEVFEEFRKNRKERKEAIDNYFKAKWLEDKEEIVYGEVEFGDPNLSGPSGPCKDCGGGGGALSTCVNLGGKSACIKIDPNIDINWGWPPSGDVNGGTITITINF